MNLHLGFSKDRFEQVREEKTLIKLQVVVMEQPRVGEVELLLVVKEEEEMSREWHL